MRAHERNYRSDSCLHVRLDTTGRGTYACRMFKFTRTPRPLIRYRRKPVPVVGGPFAVMSSRGVIVARFDSIKDAGAYALRIGGRLA